MKTTVIVREYQGGYQVTVSTGQGVGEMVYVVSDQPFDAAAAATEAMAKWGVTNEEGAELMAPQEVLELVPEHLWYVDAKPQKVRY
ncbi:MAG: hypothetical protein ABL903_08545 [Methylococcales bacterium]